MKDHKQRHAARKLGQTSGPPPPDATPAEGMEHLLRTPQGGGPLAQRSCLIEPVFGDRKHNRGVRHFFRRRGLNAVRSEWAFIHLAGNMLKLYQAPPPQPRPPDPPARPTRPITRHGRDKPAHADHAQQQHHTPSLPTSASTHHTHQPPCPLATTPPAPGPSLHRPAPKTFATASTTGDGSFPGRRRGVNALSWIQA